MAQVINTNVGALFAGAALNKSALALQTAQQRLSSGLRINSAADDATGLGIATTYDSKIRGANMQIRNANDGISKAQISDGYLAQITENTQRLREIYVQTGAVSNQEATALLAENARIDGLVTASSAVTVDERRHGRRHGYDLHRCDVLLQPGCIRHRVDRHRHRPCQVRRRHVVAGFRRGHAADRFGELLGFLQPRHGYRLRCRNRGPGQEQHPATGRYRGPGAGQPNAANRADPAALSGF